MSMSRGLRWCSFLVMLTLASAAPVRAEAPSANELVARLLSTRATTPYELRADFSGTITLTIRGSQYTAVTTGSYREWYRTGEPRRREAAVHRIQLPVLLRPFTKAFGSLIAQGIETDPEDPKTFDHQDSFVLDGEPGGRYRVAGVRRDVVDEAIDRYRPGANRQDTATRQAVAKWLYTSASMRSWILRSGPPYAFVATVSEGGLLYELTTFYDWGQLGTKIGYAVVNDQPVWRELISDVIGEAPGVGTMNGRLTVTFANYCMNCR